MSSIHFQSWLVCNLHAYLNRFGAQPWRGRAINWGAFSRSFHRRVFEITAGTKPSFLPFFAISVFPSHTHCSHSCMYQWSNNAFILADSTILVVWMGMSVSEILHGWNSGVVASAVWLIFFRGYAVELRGVEGGKYDILYVVVTCMYDYFSNNLKWGINNTLAPIDDRSKVCLFDRHYVHTILFSTLSKWSHWRQSWYHDKQLCYCTDNITNISNPKINRTPK